MQPAKNRRRLVTRAAESFTSLGVNLLGVVVNRVGDDKRDTIYADSTTYGYAYAADDDHDPHDKHSPTVGLDEPLTDTGEVSSGQSRRAAAASFRDGWPENEKPTTADRRPIFILFPSREPRIQIAFRFCVDR